MIFSDELKSCLAPLSKVDRDYFLASVRKHYVAAGNYILGKKLIESNNILRSFGYLKPGEVKKG